MFNVYLWYYCSITFQISIIATISAHIAGKDNVSTGKPDIIHDKGMSASLLSLDSLPRASKAVVRSYENSHIPDYCNTPICAYISS